MPRPSTAVPRSSDVAPLYRKLRPRPNGPSRDDVVANQRRRLHGAMVQATDAHGYSDTSVAKLCRLAGISKRTFYEQFENKEACFLASYELITGRAADLAESALPAHPELEPGLTDMFTAILSEVAVEPKAARLALLSARALDPAALSRPGSPRVRLEQAIGESFAARQPDGRFPAMVSRGIFCGAERVIRKALDAERLERPANLATQLAKWAAAYSYPGLSSIAVGKSGALSDPDAHRRIPQRPSTRRARILRATAELLSAGDYDELTLMRIAARAGVDEDTVRDWYDSPEACLMDTVDLMGLEALIVALDASRRAGDGIAGVCSGVGALMRRMADDSVLRDVLIREPPRTSAAAQQRTEQLLRNLLDVFLERVPHTGERPWVSYEATLGALWGAVSEHLRWHDPTTLTGEAPHVIYLALTPLLGAADTVAALNAQEGRVPLPKTIVDK